jgi:hypothetical protein
LFGLRFVLDELDKLVAVNHLTRRDRQVFAGFEGAGVGHAHAPFLQIGGKIAHTLGQAGTSRFHDAFERSRIGEQKIGRRHRVHELLEVEFEASFLRGILTASPLGLLNKIVRGYQIHLL